MKYFKSTYPLLLLMGVVIITVITSCDKDDYDTAQSTIMIGQVLKENSDLSLFKAALAKADLSAFTEGAGPFTYLAPDNAAFNMIGINTEADIKAMDPIELVNILTYHIIPGRRLAVEIPVGPNANITTEGGRSVYASKYTPDIFLNGVKITTPDLVASNGIIHKINRVLFPPLVNALAFMQTNPDLKLFVQAINKAAVSTTFTATPSLVTVFAPTNAAMTAAGYDSTAIANSTAAILSPIVRYHAVNARIYSSEFKTDSLKSVQGDKFFMERTGATAKVKGKSNTGFANVTNIDVSVTNGVLHVIDGLLLR